MFFFACRDLVFDFFQNFEKNSKLDTERHICAKFGAYRSGDRFKLGSTKSPEKKSKSTEKQFYRNFEKLR